MKISWDNYFMSIAEAVSTRATCDRKHAGAVIVKDKRILATGYNGSMVGAEHCDDVGHLIEHNHCIRTVHAEKNAILQCAKYGISCNGANIYVNTFPCWNCFQAIVNAGIKTIYYSSDYEAAFKSLVFEYAEKLNIGLIRLSWVTEAE